MVYSEKTSLRRGGKVGVVTADAAPQKGRFAGAINKGMCRRGGLNVTNELLGRGAVRKRDLRKGSSLLD